jgi:hypothetical protein
MTWKIKIGDILELPNDVYHYEVKDVYRNWAVLENCLTHHNKEVKVSSIKEEARIIRRKD